MKSNYTLLRVWGIPIRINISLLVFLPILAWLIGSGEQLSAYASVIDALAPVTVDAADLTGETDRWVIGIAAAVGLFASVTVHELGHAWMAMRYDIGVESITLWILGGLASLSEMPKEWNREFWIAIAGPVSSVLLGLVCIGALFVIPQSLTVVLFIVGFLAVMNLVLAGFNMLPAFPMDGGRVLRALLARNRPYVSATQTAARVGTGFALLFAFVGIVVAFSPILVLLALFIYVAATSESRSVVLGELLEGLSAEDLLTESESVAADAPISEAFDRMLAARRSELVVTDDDAVVGVLTAERLREVPLEAYETTTAGSIATTDLPRIDSATSAFDALMQLTGERADAGIVERDGRPVAVLSRNDITTMLDLRRETTAF
jgi:Zn-dependent protease/CBS domain-containing protein